MKIIFENAKGQDGHGWISFQKFSKRPIQLTAGCLPKNRIAGLLCANTWSNYPELNISIQLFLKTRETAAACQPEHVIKLLLSRDLTIPRQNISIQLFLETRGSERPLTSLNTWTNYSYHVIYLLQGKIFRSNFFSKREKRRPLTSLNTWTQLLPSRDLTTPRQNISIQCFLRKFNYTLNMHLFRMQHQRIFSQEQSKIKLKLEIKTEN